MTYPSNLLSHLWHLSHRHDTTDRAVWKLPHGLPTTWAATIDPLHPSRLFLTVLRRHADIQRIRKYMREMSTLSGVPIEPEEQTRLLDACSALPGVIGGGVPGGGFPHSFSHIAAQIRSKHPTNA